MCCIDRDHSDVIVAVTVETYCHNRCCSVSDHRDIIDAVVIRIMVTLYML